MRGLGAFARRFRHSTACSVRFPTSKDLQATQLRRDDAVDLAKISTSLVLDESGIYVPAGASSASSISFPEDGYDACFELEDRSFWFAHRNECIARALARHPFDGAFLDVGGGNGAVSNRLRADGIDAVVLEPGRDGANNARKRGIRTVVCATIEQANFAPASFGGAGLFDVIEHVPDDDALLRIVSRVLAPRGVLAVTVPAYEWLWSAEDDGAGHHRRYTRRSLCAVLERAGFEVVYATYFFAALIPPVFLGRSLRYRFGRRASPEVASEAATHHVPSGIVRRGIDLALGPEQGVIRAGGRIPFGTSCLAIARVR